MIVTAFVPIIAAPVMWRSHLPPIGIVTSVGLFLAAAARYPGGTTDSATTTGYDWTRNFISSLFAPVALNGAPNSARMIAIPAMLLLCVSLGVLFKSISSKSGSKIHRKTIEIGGIASAVYAFLAVTPLHNLMIDISLPFALIAMLATLHLLYVVRSLRLFLVGSISILLLLVTAAMYYEHLFFGLLPIFQKVSMLACVGWLVAVHYTGFERHAAGRLVHA